MVIYVSVLEREISCSHEYYPTQQRLDLCEFFTLKVLRIYRHLLRYGLVQTSVVRMIILVDVCLIPSSAPVS